MTLARRWLIGVIAVNRPCPRFILIALCVLTAMSAVALAGQSPRRRISFSEALELSLRHNRGLRAAELRSRSAEYAVGEARGAMLPRLDALENYTNSNNPTTVFSNLLNQQDFGASNFNVDRLNDPASLSNFQSEVRLSQSIFAGGRMWAALKASRDEATAEQWRLTRARQETVFAVVQAYYGAVLLEQRVDVLERALAAAQAHRAQAVDLLAHGMVLKADVLRTEVMAGSLEQERNYARNQLLTAWDSLGHLMGQEDQAIAPLAQPPEFEAASAPENKLEELAARAVAARPEIKIAQAQVDRTLQALRIARSEYLPSIGAAAAYENDSKSLARAGNSYSVFVTGQLNLFDGLATSSKVSAAEAELARARELRDDLTHGVALEVESAYHALAAANENVAVARRDDLSAEEALRILTDRYGAGLATNIEVLDAETARKEAAMRLADSRAAVLVGTAALKLASGDLNGSDHP